MYRKRKYKVTIKTQDTRENCLNIVLECHCIPLGLNSTCYKVTYQCHITVLQDDHQLLVLHYTLFQYKPLAFFIPCILGSSYSGSPLVVIHRSRCCNSAQRSRTIQFTFLGLKNFKAHKQQFIELQNTS
jgi:hypothetical protein